jgi:hypothetical protein
MILLQRQLPSALEPLQFLEVSSGSEEETDLEEDL